MDATFFDIAINTEQKFVDKNNKNTMINARILFLFTVILYFRRN